MSEFEIRFWSKINLGNADQCWLWNAGLANKKTPYGRVRVGNSLQFAHRVAYTLINGDIPNGLYVCHACDIPRCCNPSHLFLGTPADNVHDMIAKGRNR